MTQTSCYLISYDLRNANKNYDSLYDAFNNLTYSKRILESFRFVKSTRTLEWLYNYIKNTLDQDDGLYVTKYSWSATWSNIDCKNEDIKWKC